MRAPLLLLLVSLQIIHLAESAVLPPWYFKKCPHLVCAIMTRYPRCLAGSLLLKYYPQCGFHPNFKNNIRCKGLQYYRPIAQSIVGCNPAEHVVMKVDNTKQYVAPTCGTLYNLIIRSMDSDDGLDTFKCPEARKTCSRGIFQRYLIPVCCVHPVVRRAERSRCRGMQNYRRKRADFDSKLLDPSPETSYGSSEPSYNSLWNVTEKSTDHLPPMFLETDVTTSNTSLDVRKYRSKRQVVPDIPVLPASLMDELTENSPEAVSVTCCKDSATKYCGADTGNKCSTVCGGQGVEAVDVVASDDVCNPEITGGGAGRRRRKRAAGWSAATIASWRLNWCTRKVSKNKGGYIWYYRICCYHPAVLKYKYHYTNPRWARNKNIAAGKMSVGTFCNYEVSREFGEMDVEE